MDPPELATQRLPCASNAALRGAFREPALAVMVTVGATFPLAEAGKTLMALAPLSISYTIRGEGFDALAGVVVVASPVIRAPPTQRDTAASPRTRLAPAVLRPVFGALRPVLPRNTIFRQWVR